jgi:hypothetical protein
MTKIQAAEKAIALAVLHNLDELEIPGVARIKRRPVAPIAPADERKRVDDRAKRSDAAVREERIKADLERFEGGGL